MQDLLRIICYGVRCGAKTQGSVAWGFGNWRTRVYGVEVRFHLTVYSWMTWGLGSTNALPSLVVRFKGQSSGWHGYKRYFSGNEFLLEASKYWASQTK